VNDLRVNIGGDETGFERAIQESKRSTLEYQSFWKSTLAKQEQLEVQSAREAARRSNQARRLQRQRADQVAKREQMAEAASLAAAIDTAHRNNLARRLRRERAAAREERLVRERELARANSFVGRARNAVGGMLGGIGGRIAGALTAGAVYAMARNTMSYADELEETSTRLGISTKKLQEWDYAAKQSGASIYDLTRFTEQLVDAALDPKRNKELQKIGINASGMTPEQLVEAVSRFTRGKSSSEVRSGLGDIVNTRQLGRMMNFLQSDLEQLGKAAHEAGAVMEDGTLRQLAALNDQFGILSQILMTQFAPALLVAAKFMLSSFGRVKATGGFINAATKGFDISLGAVMKRQMFPGQWLVDGVKALKDVDLPANLKTAKEVYSRESSGIEKMLKALENWKPTDMATIGSPTLEEKEEKKKLEKMNELQMDQLSKAGLFAGGAGGGMNKSNLPEQQLQAMREIVRVHAQTYQLVMRILG
jgi:hypothetical protein